MLGGVHGDDETKVFQELSEVVDEWIATLRRDRKPLPPRTAGKHYSGKFVLRVGEDLHRALTVSSSSWPEPQQLFGQSAPQNDWSGSSA